MPEYLAVYGVSSLERRGNEYIGSWSAESKDVVKRFGASDDSKAKEMACGEVFKSISERHKEGPGIKNVEIKLRFVLEARVIEDNRPEFEQQETVYVPEEEANSN